MKFTKTTPTTNKLKKINTLSKKLYFKLISLNDEGIKSIIDKLIITEAEKLKAKDINPSLLFILNKTIKPLLFYLTIPITGITLGLFYPFINLIIFNYYCL